MRNMGKVESSGFTGLTVLDIHGELNHAKRTFWLELAVFAIFNSTANVAHSNPSLEVTAIFFFLATFVAMCLHVRGVARAATAAGYSPTGWGIMVVLFPLTVWFLNGRINRQYGTYPKVGL
ncbi:MAG: hypothetical protein WBG20_03830 [Candidatus Deferrimicrobiaceae bacterium]